MNRISNEDTTTDGLDSASIQKIVTLNDNANHEDNNDMKITSDGIQITGVDKELSENEVEEEYMVSIFSSIYKRIRNGFFSKNMSDLLI